MDLLRLLPARYCPECGGAMRRARLEGKGASLLGALYGGFELVGYAALGVGALVGHFTGAAFGFIIGAATGLLLFAACASAVIRLDRKYLVCACSRCGREFPFRQCRAPKTVVDAANPG